MAEYIEREAIRLAYERSLKNDKHVIEGASAIHAQEHHHIFHILDKIPAADVVSRATFEQAMWERDVAIQQLKDLGVGFGEKADVAPVVRCDECIHQENCMRQIVFWERDNVLEQNTSKYHKLEFCSYGEPKRERRSK